MRSIDDLCVIDRQRAPQAMCAMRRAVSSDTNETSTAYAPRKSSSNSTMLVVRWQLTGHHVIGKIGTARSRGQRPTS